MKATEQYFPVALFIMPYKVVLTFESEDDILWRDHSSESYQGVLSCDTVYYFVQGGSNYFTVVLFLMLYEVDLTFELVDVTLKRDHWNERD